MRTNLRCTLAALGLLLAPLAAPAHAWEIFPPFKVNLTFRFDLVFTAQPQPTAPWWAYFPQGAHQQAPGAGPAFPHWPAQLPATGRPVSAPHAPAAGPNVVYGPVANALQPVSYYPAQAPSYWYGR
ncbi:MAG: hypothetical protein AAB289_05165 [Chloroflexota bacterium]